MADPVVDRVAVQINADLTKFAQQLQTGIDAQLMKTQRAATQVVQSIERDFSSLASSIRRTMQEGSSSATSSLHNMQDSARSTGSSIGSDFRRAAEQSNGDFRSMSHQFQETAQSIDSQAQRMGQSIKRGSQEGSNGISELLKGGGSGGIMGLLGAIPGVGIAAGFMGGILASKFQMISSLVSNAISMATNAVKSFIQLGIETSVNWEQSQLKFQALTGSVKEGTAIFEELKQFAALTPFELSDILPAATRFVAFAKGVNMTNAQLKDYLTITGGIASLLGENGGNYTIQQLSMVFGQIASKGKLAYEEVMQISEALPGFSGVAVIAAHYGITTAEAQQKLSAGSINAADGVAILLDGMRKFPGVANAMQTQSKTLGGLWSTMKDTMAQTAATFVAPFIPTIKKAIDWLSTTGVTTFQKAIADIKGYLKEVGADVPGLAASFAKFDFKEIKKDVKEWVQLFIDHKAEIKDMIDGMVIGIQMLISAILVGSDVTRGFMSITLDSFRLMVFAAQYFVDVFLNGLSMILNTAVAAFGWVPGLGDKLRTAQQNVANLHTQASELFGALRSGAAIHIDTWGALNAIAGVRAAVGNLRNDIGAGMALTYSSYYYSTFGGHASGGVESPGGAPFWVGEKGPELMQYDRNGLLKILSSQKSNAYVTQMANGGDGASLNIGAVNVTVSIPHTGSDIDPYAAGQQVGNGIVDTLSASDLYRRPRPALAI
jgi:tape measure domain-containing protein